MGSKASLCLREDELAAIHRETGCKFTNAICLALDTVEYCDFIYLVVSS